MKKLKTGKDTSVITKVRDENELLGEKKPEVEKSTFRFQ